MPLILRLAALLWITQKVQELRNTFLGQSPTHHRWVFVLPRITLYLLTLVCVCACDFNRSKTTSSGDSEGEQLAQIAEIGSNRADAKRESHHFFQEIMGTMFRIELISYDRQSAMSAARAAFNEVRRIEHQVSSWRSSSEIGQLNDNAGKTSVTLSYETAWLLCKSKNLTELSRGAFDITWATLKGLWDFKARKVPAPDLLRSRLSSVGMKYLSLSIQDESERAKHCDTLLKGERTESPYAISSRFSKNSPLEWSWRYQAELLNAETQIDLGGIAKGFAVDQAVSALKRLGYSDFLFDGGGDLRVEGRSLDGSPWSVGIHHPRDEITWGQLWVPSGWSVVTSGDYERFFMEGHQRFHHIIDLRTGYPAQASVAVTVIAQSALLADTLATAVFILGPYEGIALIDSLSGVEALCFTPTGEVISSQGAHVFSPRLLERWRE